MNTKALFPCGGGSNSILGTGTENQKFSDLQPLSSFFMKFSKNDEEGPIR